MIHGELVNYSRKIFQGTCSCWEKRKNDKTWRERNDEMKKNDGERMADRKREEKGTERK